MRISVRSCCFLILILLAVPCLVLTGCVDNADAHPNTATYRDTVDGVFWEITYDTDTSEIVSIYTPVALMDIDRRSLFYNFMRAYKGDWYDSMIHSVVLSGVPIGNGYFKITQTETYSSNGNITDWEYIKETFPNCEYSESYFLVTDNDTGITSTAVSGEITFSTAITEYEVKIDFPAPPVNQ